MNKGKAILAVLLAGMVVFLSSCAEPQTTRLDDAADHVQTVNSTGVKALFTDPPREYSSAPLNCTREAGR